VSTVLQLELAAQNTCQDGHLYWWQTKHTPNTALQSQGLKDILLLYFDENNVYHIDSRKKNLKKLLCCCPQGACCLRTCTLLKSPDIMITRSGRILYWFPKCEQKELYTGVFFLSILWCDSRWQLATRRRISHIWLYRSEKKANFFKESYYILVTSVMFFWGRPD
jgi:hypothetical protein